jgi:hypothetical protein
MIVMGEYILIEGRYGKAFVKVLRLFYRAPIACSKQMKTIGLWQSLSE